jgi:hypothetical protein
VNDRRNVLLCILVFLAAVVAIDPRLEMGVNDDWAFTRICREFAATGHIAYNGWEAPALVPQIVWGAAFVRLFGFSFLAVRMSTVLLTALLIPVLYRLARESGLQPGFAAFAALLTVLSPLMLPLELSFMSDVPAFVLFVFCLYAGVRAWRAPTVAACAGWALLISFTGLLAGLNRQIYWMAPLLFLPVIGWVQRRNHARRAVINSAAMVFGATWIFTCAAVLGCLRWIQAQPYMLSEDWRQGWEDGGLRILASQEILLTVQVAATLALLLIPILAGFVVPGLRSAGRTATILVSAATMAAGFAALQWRTVRFPWLQNLLSQYGAVPVGVTITTPPRVLGSTLQAAVSMIVTLCCAWCGLALWKLRKPAGPRSPGELTPLPVVTLGGIFTAGWLAVILIRSAGTPAFDRYLISLLPLFAIPLLQFFQVHICARVSRLSWVGLAVFACYGVGVTHDAFAGGRARLAAAQVLERRGIPRTEIAAGFDYDGETQIEAQGYLNYPKISNPPDAYHRVECTTGPFPHVVWYFPMMTALRVRYFILTSDVPPDPDGPVGPIPYTTWLPPARRNVYTQMVPGSDSVGCN